MSIFFSAPVNVKSVAAEGAELPNAGSGEEAARLGRLAGVLLARVGGEALPEPQGLVGAAADLIDT